MGIETINDAMIGGLLDTANMNSIIEHHLIEMEIHSGLYKIVEGEGAFKGLHKATVLIHHKRLKEFLKEKTEVANPDHHTHSQVMDIFSKWMDQADEYKKEVE